MGTNLDVLQEVGLSKAEALVYLTLLKLGKTHSGKVIKLSGLQSSVVHNALNTLIEKGFVAYSLEGKIKNYSALDPKIIQESIEAKKQSYKQILPELQLIQEKSKQEVTTVEVYEGYKGLLTATLELIENSKKSDIFRYFAANEAVISEEALNFFQKVDMFKKEKGIIVRGIGDEKARNKLKKYTNSEIRYVKQKIPPAMNIFKNGILIISLLDKPVAILIKSNEIAAQYNQLWEEMWHIAKK